MGTWIREILGWLLLSFGLVILIGAFFFLFAAEEQVVTGGIMAVMGIVIFRAGIHFLKVAFAGRVYLQARAAKAATDLKPTGTPVLRFQQKKRA